MSWHAIPALIDAVEPAMRSAYGRRVAPIATAWFIDLFSDQPEREAIA